MQYRNLPSVDRVMASETLLALTAEYPRDWVVDLVRAQLDQARTRIGQGADALSAVELAELVCRELGTMTEVAPKPVINATGVIIHTNLGRAPLSQAATDAMVRASRTSALVLASDRALEALMPCPSVSGTLFGWLQAIGRAPWIISIRHPPVRLHHCSPAFTPRSI